MTQRQRLSVSITRASVIVAWTQTPLLHEAPSPDPGCNYHMDMTHSPSIDRGGEGVVSM